MRVINVQDTNNIPIGKKGENNVTTVLFPFVKKWKELFGNGTFQLLFERPGESLSYAVVVDTDEENVRWIVTNTELAKNGVGKCELRYVVEDAVAKSQTFICVILDTIAEEGGEPPEPWQSWVDEVLEAGAAAQESAISAAESATSSAESAEAAAESATSSAESATSSAESAVSATESAESAAESAEAAAESATSSAESATSSAESAVSATESAESAAESAEAAEAAKEAVESALEDYVRKDDFATSADGGIVKADPATDEDTQPVRIGENHKLYTKKVAANIQDGSGDKSLKQATVPNFLYHEGKADERYIPDPATGETLPPNEASGAGAVALGIATKANADAAHAEGIPAVDVEQVGEDILTYTQALDRGAHAEGCGTQARGKYTHTEGYGTVATGQSSHAEGDRTSVAGRGCHAEGWNSYTEEADAAHAEGKGSITRGMAGHSEGQATRANKRASHAEGLYSQAGNPPPEDSGINGVASHAEGNQTITTADYSHAEGSKTIASGKQSHAEGSESESSGSASHAEGRSQATAWASHSEGDRTVASGDSSHAEGRSTTASGQYSHAEGYSSTASGKYAHSEGGSSIAKGNESHAEGSETQALNWAAHAEGVGTKTYESAQHVAGKWNVNTSGARITGAGTDNSHRKNIEILDWNGNLEIVGRLIATRLGIKQGSSVRDIKIDDLIASVLDVLPTKADKVQNPTNGHLAGLDGNGNLTDSGKTVDDFAPAPIIKTTMDSVAVEGAVYLLGTQTAVAISMPTDASLGQEIVVSFTSGSTACTLTCDLTGFDFVPKANKTSWIKFTLYHKADTEVVGDTDKWLVETKEG